MEFVKIAFTIATAVTGWLVAHHYTSRRDTKNSRRLTRIEALSSCYKALARAGIDGVMVTKGPDGKAINKAIPVEDAIALVHLYGSQEQSDLASEYAQQVAETQNGDSTKLVNCLRRDVREMLGEPDLSHDPIYLRITLKE
jgi:phage FluMu protein Com